MLKIEKDKHSKKKIYILIASAFFILIVILFIGILYSLAIFLT